VEEILNIFPKTLSFVRAGGKPYKGVQSQGVGACLKHFAANNQEHRRMTVDTIVDERTLREYILQALRML